MNLELRSGDMGLGYSNFLDERLKALGIERTPEMNTVLIEAVIEIDSFLREHGILRDDQEIFVSEDLEEENE